MVREVKTVHSAPQETTGAGWRTYLCATWLPRFRSQGRAICTPAGSPRSRSRADPGPLQLYCVPAGLGKPCAEKMTNKSCSCPCRSSTTTSRWCEGLDAGDEGVCQPERALRHLHKHSPECRASGPDCGLLLAAGSSQRYCLRCCCTASFFAKYVSSDRSRQNRHEA